MKRTLMLLLAASALVAAPAQAGPRNNKHFLFPSSDECELALWTLFRGNHAYWCEWTPAGWYITEDFDIKENRKTPHK